MRRETSFHEGYDCRDGICDAPKRHKDKRVTHHGCHGDTWCYMVTDDEAGHALSLEVFTDDYKGARGELAQRGKRLGYPHEYREPHAAWLTLHRSYPTTNEELLHGPASCDYAPGGKCYAGGLECSATVGEIPWKHADKTHHEPQPEAFWKEMERILILWTADLKRIDLEWEKCSHCDGSGVVRK